MKFLPLALSFMAITAQAASLDVVVSEDNLPVRSFNYVMRDDLQTLDLREQHYYDAAFHDPVTKKDICRPGLYMTGLQVAFKSVPKSPASVELLGNVSSVKSITDGAKLSCGTHQVVDMKNQAFSQFVDLKPLRPKALVIDKKWTLIITLNP